MPEPRDESGDTARAINAQSYEPRNERAQINHVARVLMAAWEKAEGEPVGVSYVATFADMARAAIEDQATRIEEYAERRAETACQPWFNPMAGARAQGRVAGLEQASEIVRGIVFPPAQPEQQSRADVECGSCGEGLPTGECPKSKRPCGHHCNHIWTHDECDWCGTVEEALDLSTPPGGGGSDQ